MTDDWAISADACDSSPVPFIDLWDDSLADATLRHCVERAASTYGQMPDEFVAFAVQRAIDFAADSGETEHVVNDAFTELAVLRRLREVAAGDPDLRVVFEDLGIIG
jgi:hypothetical protein